MPSRSQSSCETHISSKSGSLAKTEPPMNDAWCRSTPACTYAWSSQSATAIFLAPPPPQQTQTLVSLSTQPPPPLPIWCQVSAGGGVRKEGAFAVLLAQKFLSTGKTNGYSYYNVLLWRSIRLHQYFGIDSVAFTPWSKRFSDPRPAKIEPRGGASWLEDLWNQGIAFINCHG